MHNTIDYSKSSSPRKAAIADIKAYLGEERYAKVNPEMAKLTHCGNFAMYCALAGIQGFPVIAWYELHHGWNSWKPHELDYLK